MNELRSLFLFAVLIFIISLSSISIFKLKVNTPVAEDILHLQTAIAVCNDKDLQPFSTDHNSVTCSDGKVYHLEK